MIQKLLRLHREVCSVLLDFFLFIYPSEYCLFNMCTLLECPVFVSLFSIIPSHFIYLLYIFCDPTLLV